MTSENRLHGNQATVRNDHGDVLYISNNVCNEIIVQVNGARAQFPVELVKKAMMDLFPDPEGKHVKEAPHDEV